MERMHSRLDVQGEVECTADRREDKWDCEVPWYRERSGEFSTSTASVDRVFADIPEETAIASPSREKVHLYIDDGECEIVDGSNGEDWLQCIDESNL